MESTNTIKEPEARRPAQAFVLVPELPSKPKFKEPCNGCGLCCAMEVCHAGKLIFGDIEGPCPALAMSRDRTRVVCSFVET